MEALVLDSDVVIGLLHAEDEHHGRAVTALCQSAEVRFLMAMSSYSEILVGLIAKRRESVAEALVERARIVLVPVDRPLATRAAQLRVAHPSLRLPDALSLATALENGAKLMTFDKRLHRIASRLT